MSEIKVDPEKLCPLCGKPMQKVGIKTSRRDYELWTCVPCVKEADKKRVVATIGGADEV